MKTAEQTPKTICKGANSTCRVKECITRKKKIDWFMLRYIKHLQEPIKRNYEIIPYSKIKEMGAGMYKGVKKE